MVYSAGALFTLLANAAARSICPNPPPPPPPLAAGAAGAAGLAGIEGLGLGLGAGGGPLLPMTELGRDPAGVEVPDELAVGRSPLTAAAAAGAGGARRGAAAGGGGGAAGVSINFKLVRIQLRITARSHKKWDILV